MSYDSGLIESNSGDEQRPLYREKRWDVCCGFYGLFLSSEFLAFKNSMSQTEKVSMEKTFGLRWRNCTLLILLFSFFRSVSRQTAMRHFISSYHQEIFVHHLIRLICWFFDGKPNVFLLIWNFCYHSIVQHLSIKGKMSLDF